MSSAYTPGLEVRDGVTIEKIRELPLPGKVCVSFGQKVSAETTVLSAEMPGELEIVRVADALGLEPEDVLPGMQVKVGDSLQRGQLIAQVKTFFGLCTAKLKSPSAGTIEFYTASNGHLGVRQPARPFTLDAYIDGEVVDVQPGRSVSIRSQAALIQGIFGVGGECRGKVFALEIGASDTVNAEFLAQLGTTLKDCVLIGGAHYEQAALSKAAELGVRAVVTASIDSDTLEHFLGYKLSLSVTGDENVPFTLIVTEGFGRLSMSSRVVELAATLHGRMASVNGATQVRAGAMRPEVVVSATQASAPTKRNELSLDVGSRVRLIRVPYFGMFANVTELPSEPAVIPTGARVRVLKARLESGEAVVVPRANVELV